MWGHSNGARVTPKIFELAALSALVGGNIFLTFYLTDLDVEIV